MTFRTLLMQSTVCLVQIARCCSSQIYGFPTLDGNRKSNGRPTTVPKEAGTMFCGLTRTTVALWKPNMCVGSLYSVLQSEQAAADLALALQAPLFVFIRVIPTRNL